MDKQNINLLKLALKYMSDADEYDRKARAIVREVIRDEKTHKG